MKTYLKSKIFPIISLVFISISLVSCRYGYNDPYPIDQSGFMVEQEIPLRNFDRVDMGCAFRVFIRKGSTYSIIAKGDQYDIEDLEAKVTSGKLNIKYKNFRNNRFEMIFYITMPNFTSGTFYQAAYAEVDNFIENSISIKASGASSLFIDSDAKNWDIELSCSSDLEMIGQGNTLNLDVSGESSIKALKLFVNYVDLNLTGSSNAWVYANKEIIGKASGGSGIRCRGNSVIDIKTTGSSWVERY